MSRPDDKDLLAWLTLTAGVILETIGLALLKFASSALLSVSGLAGLALFFLAPLLIAVALSRLDLSCAIPVRTGLSVLLVAVGGVVIFGETIGLQQGSGMVMLIVGIALVGRG